VVVAPFLLLSLCFLLCFFFLFLLSSSVSLLGATGGCGEEEHRWRFRAEGGRRWFFFFPLLLLPWFSFSRFCSVSLLPLWFCCIGSVDGGGMTVLDGGGRMVVLVVDGDARRRFCPFSALCFFLFYVSFPSRFCLLLLCLFFLFLSLGRWLKVELLRGDWEERWLFSSIFCLALSLSSVSQKTIPRLVSLSLLLSVLFFLFFFCSFLSPFYL